MRRHAHGTAREYCGWFGMGFEIKMTIDAFALRQHPGNWVTRGVPDRQGVFRCWVEIDYDRVVRNGVVNAFALGGTVVVKGRWRGRHWSER
jgi:hypothetical protein